MRSFASTIQLTDGGQLGEFGLSTPLKRIGTEMTSLRSSLGRAAGSACMNDHLPDDGNGTSHSDKKRDRPEICKQVSLGMDFWGPWYRGDPQKVRNRIQAIATGSQDRNQNKPILEHVTLFRQDPVQQRKDV